MITPVIRSNGKMLTRASTAVRVNSQARITGVESIDWSDKVSLELIHAMNSGAPPLGVAIGGYETSASISIYADEAYNFEAAVMGEGLGDSPVIDPVKNLTDAVFNITVTMREEQRSRYALWVGCVIVGRPQRTVSHDGSAVVMKYDVQPRVIIEDGRCLVDVMSSVPGFSGSGSALDPTSDEHNYVIVNGSKSPGRAQLTGVERPYKWDIQPGYGLSGAWTRFRGPDIAKPLLTLTFWTLAHFIGWASFKQAIKPPSPAAPFFISMQHPLLSAADIKAVGVESVGEPMRAPGAAIWQTQIKLIEYRPPAPIIVKPKGSVPGVVRGKPTPPKTEADFETLEMGARYLVARAADLGLSGVTMQSARQTIADMGLDRATEQALGPAGPPAPGQ